MGTAPSVLKDRWGQGKRKSDKAAAVPEDNIGGLFDGASRPEGPLAVLYNRLSNARSIINWKTFKDVTHINSELIAVQLFRALDKDKDGVISFSDLSRVVALFGEPGASFSEQLKFLFTLLDVNDDRYVCKDDMTRILNAALSKTHHIAIPKLVIEEMVDEAFESYDSDLDGKLTIENFRKMIIDQPQWIDVFSTSPLVSV